jgi:hypothetical protein
MRALNRLIEDIRSRTNLELYMLVAIATVIVALDIFGVVDPPVIYAAILAVLVFLLYGRIEDHHRFKALMSKGQMRGIRRFYPNRPSLPPLNSTLLAAEHEVLIIGFSLTYLMRTQQSTVEKIAFNGRKVRLAAWSPPQNDPARKLLIGSVQELVGLTDLEGFLSTTIRQIQHWYNSLGQEARRNIEIRGYTTIPTSVIVCIDSDYPQGYIRVEPILYKTPPECIPAFELTERDDPDLYRVLKKTYSELWNGAQSIV